MALRPHQIWCQYHIAFGNLLQRFQERGIDVAQEIRQQLEDTSFFKQMEFSETSSFAPVTIRDDLCFVANTQDYIPLPKFAETVNAHKKDTAASGRASVQSQLPENSVLVCMAMVHTDSMRAPQWNCLIDYFEAVGAKTVYLVVRNSRTITKSSVACRADSVYKRIVQSGIATHRVAFDKLCINPSMSELVPPVIKRLSAEEREAWIQAHPNLDIAKLGALLPSDAIIQHYAFQRDDLIYVEDATGEVSYFLVRTQP